MKLLFLAILGMAFSLSAKSQNFGMGTSAPHQSAALDISDTTRGILIPRMSMSQRLSIQSPAEGLMVYQNDSSKGYWYWNGTDWKSILAYQNTTQSSGSKMKVFNVGNYNWIAPEGVSNVVVELWGAGGGGGTGGNFVGIGSGGAGGYGKQSIPVIPGQTYSITVGQGGAGGSTGSNGGRTSFNDQLIAQGGTGGGCGGCNYAGIGGTCNSTEINVTGGGGTYSSSGQGGASGGPNYGGFGHGGGVQGGNGANGLIIIYY